MIIKRPPFLKSGDQIGIVATARWLEEPHIEIAKKVFEQRGWGVVLADNIYSKHFQLAGNALDRAKGFQSMMDRKDVSAVIVGRGGYGTVDVIDRIDWSHWLKRPSWICGYSDVTALLGEVYQLGVASVHSTMPVSFHDATAVALEQLCDALEGKLTRVEWKTSLDRLGEITGPVVGGNLSVLYSILGSKSFPKGEFILFLEDVDEMTYHIHRMMMGFLRAGVLSQAKAVVLGGMTKMKDNTIEFGFPTDNSWGQTALESVVEVCSRLGILVVDGFPAGHMSDNRAFYHGLEAKLLVNEGNAELTWTF